MIVTDKNGQRVTRPNGILQDGDVMRVPMNLMDSQNPGLVAAASLAHSVRSAEQFDMKQHPQYARHGTQDVTTLAARAARIKRQEEEWKKPPKIGALIKVAGKNVDTTGLSPADARDKRMADMWRQPTSVTNDTATAKEIVAVVGASAPVEQLHAAVEQAVKARDKRLETAYLRDKQIEHALLRQS